MIVCHRPAQAFTALYGLATWLANTRPDTNSIAVSR
jgi:hypothetical protein